VALKIAIEMNEALRYKVRMMGIPIEGLTCFLATGKSGGIQKNPVIPGFFPEFTRNTGSKMTGNSGPGSGKTEFRTGNNN
jgi:hypothetical protein